MAELKVFGKRIPSKMGPSIVTGGLKYPADIYLPGMLYGRYLVSPYPHAEVKSIDTSAAKALQGVRAVLTYGDVGPLVMSKASSNNMYPITNKARYVGDTVAAVAADTPEIAEKALDLIKVEYNQLSAVYDPREALKPGAPQIHADKAGKVEQPGNYYVHEEYQIRWGDPEAGLKQADKIYERDHMTQGCSNHQAGARTAVAYWEGDVLTLQVDCQGVFEERGNQSKDFKIPMSKIRCLCEMTGGGFGSNKFGRHGYLATLLSMATGKRPVKVEHSRRLELGAEAHGRSRTYQHTKIGVKQDGTITAIKLDEVSQMGGYTQDTTSRLSSVRGFKCDNVGGKVEFVYTNTAKGGWKRGVADPIGLWPVETMADEIAEDLGINPAQYRFNYMSEDIDRSNKNRPWSSCYQKRALEKVVEASGFNSRWKGWKTPVAVDGSKRRGLGLSIGTHNAGNATGSASIKLVEDGTFSLSVGTTDVGCVQGTSWSIVAAEVLGVPIDMISVKVGDTDLPECPRSAGSTNAFAAARAAKAAAEDFKKVLLEWAAPLLKVKPEELDIADGKIFVTADPTKAMTLPEFTRKIWGTGTSYGYFPLLMGKATTIPAPGVSEQSFAAYVIEVEVDVETGHVEVVNIWSCMDMGQPINAATVETQSLGGNVDGTTMALHEDRIWDNQTGVCLTTDWTTYRLPTTLDIPEVVPIVAVAPGEQGDPFGAYGAKGFSESAAVTVHCAMANAIYNAIGVRIFELPMTPEKILKALGKG